MQRRKHDRVSVSAPVRIYVDNEPAIPGDIEDISLGGAFIRCAKTIPVGKTVRIEINFSGMQVLEAKVTEIETKAPKETETNEQAVVRWSQTGNAFGVEFTALNLATQYYLTKLIEHVRAASRPA